MNIALLQHHVGGEAGGGGSVRLALELGLGLKKRGHRVTLACHDYLEGSEFSYAAEQLDIRSIRRGVSDWSTSRVAMARRFWFDMPKVARLVPPDTEVINAHEWLALRPGRIAAARLSIPLVWTRNDESPWERAVVPGQTHSGDPRPSRRALRAAVWWPDVIRVRRSNNIVVLSQLQVEMVRRSYRKTAEIVPIGPAEHFFEAPEKEAARSRLGIPKNTFLAAGAGVLLRHRRFEDLIHAISLLSDDSSIQGLIAGSDHMDPAYADSLSRLIADLDLGDRVTLRRGSVSDGEMKDTYAAADVFLLLSHHYAWGLAPLEAIAAGTPVILSEGAGVRDILAGRPGVQMVPPGDLEAISQAIQRCQAEDGRNGLKRTRMWLHEEYSIERYVERMEAIFAGSQRTSPRGAEGR